MAANYTHVLDDSVPLGYGITIDPLWRVKTVTAPKEKLPTRFIGLDARPHTWEAFVERRLNNDTYTPHPATTEFTPRPYQGTVINAISDACATKKPGFVLAYPTGSGKTSMTVDALTRTPGVRTVLVITTLTHAAAWRNTITRLGDHGIEWVVIHPHRLADLLTLDTGEQLLDYDHRTRTRLLTQRGMPLHDFDVVVTDEAQLLANVDTQRSQLWRHLVRWPHTPGDWTGAFTVNLSATPWTNPTETGSVAHLIAAATGTDCPDTWTVANLYPQWLADHGFRLRADKKRRWRWDNNPGDVTLLSRLLYGSGYGMTATGTELGLPSQNRSTIPLHLTPDERTSYNLSWTSYLHLHGLGTRDALEPGADLAAALRDVQKASWLKAPHIARVAANYVADGYQVIVTAWYGDTVSAIASHTADALAHTPLPAGVPARTISLTGVDNPTIRDAKVRAFQSGRAPVIVTSITDAISLHAGEAGGGENGQDATSTPRVTLIADVLTGGKRAYQAEGRGQRDGRTADVLYLYAHDTTEADWLATVFRSLADTRALSYGVTGDDSDVADFTRLADELDPPTDTTDTATKDNR